MGTFTVLERRRGAIDELRDRPDRAMMSIIQETDARLGADAKMLDGLNPMNVLTRGYSMITSEDGKILTAIDDVQVGRAVTIHMRDGSADAMITNKEKRT
jgi:exodeoxyribonuclease VII large subunit